MEISATILSNLGAFLVQIIMGNAFIFPQPMKSEIPIIISLFFSEKLYQLIPSSKINRKWQNFPYSHCFLGILFFQVELISSLFPCFILAMFLAVFYKKFGFILDRS